MSFQLNNIQYISDDALLDQEQNAEHIVYAWNCLDADSKAIHKLSNNDEYVAYNIAKAILEEIDLRMSEEHVEIANANS